MGQMMGAFNQLIAKLEPGSNELQQKKIAKLEKTVEKQAVTIGKQAETIAKLEAKLRAARPPRGRTQLSGSPGDPGLPGGQ